MQNGCETLLISAIRGSGYVWPEKLKRLLLPSGVRRRMRNIQMECWRRRILDVRHSGGMSAKQNSGCETSGWNVRCHTSQGGRLRVKGVGTPLLDDTERARLSESSPSGFPKRTCSVLPYPDSFREKHTTLAIITLRTIAYPIRICCPDMKHWLKCTSLATSFRQPATTHVPPPSDGVSGRPVWTSLPWIPKNSPQSRIALVIKNLSKHQNLTQFD